jgi:periplasmic copper chaperone A
MRKTTRLLAAFGVAAFATASIAQAQDAGTKPAVPKDAVTDAAAKDAKVKNIAVVAPWSRATPGGAKNGAVFLEIKAGPDAPDRLVNASGDVADAIEIHNHINDNGIMQMRRVDGIDIAEGASTKLVPGGYHIMLLGLKQPLKAGETFKLKLKFEKAGAIDVDVAVRANGAAPAKSHAH